MKFPYSIAVALVAIVGIEAWQKSKPSSGYKAPVEDKFHRQLLSKAQTYAQTLSEADIDNVQQYGEVKFTSDGKTVSEKVLANSIARVLNRDGEVGGGYVWYDSSNNLAAYTAKGLDYKHHFVNSYLLGIRPFAVENKSLPLYLLAKMKTYQLDSEQYGVAELWQNSAQAFKFPRGDCEDHAIILADWLISEGVDARVVLGTYDGGGHAWVVANVDNQVFLLEATSKRLNRTWNHYPLAKFSQKYIPEFMFNRDGFWHNTDPDNHKDYLGPHWVKRSTFKKTQAPPANKKPITL